MKTLFGIRIHVGFTGTQQGMTLHQKRIFREEFRLSQATHFHHGDCIGADADAHKLVRDFECIIIGHPPINNSKRAMCKMDVVRVAKEYLARNHDIVNACELIIATPKEHEEELRSGTWATIRYARKQNKRLIVIYPDGSKGK